VQIETDYKRRAITFADMKTFLSIGWGELGERVADAWRELNKRHFKNALEPLPIILVNTSPYGRWMGCTYCNLKKSRAHLIQLAVARQKSFLRADRGVLLHEMLHQHLTEQGHSPKHEHAPWCDGIMQLHFDLTGKRIFAAPETVTKSKDLDPRTGKRKSIRVPRRHPITGITSLDRMAIATWPHSLGLDLGPFIETDDEADDTEDDA
jgi:hypothetical protein